MTIITNLNSGPEYRHLLDGAVVQRISQSDSQFWKFMQQEFWIMECEKCIGEWKTQHHQRNYSTKHTSTRNQ